MVGPPHGPRVGGQLGPGTALAVGGALLLGAAVPAEHCVTEHGHHRHGALLVIAVAPQPGHAPHHGQQQQQGQHLVASHGQHPAQAEVPSPESTSQLR